MSETLSSSPVDDTTAHAPDRITVAAGRIWKGQLLMSGLAEEIRGSWNSLSHVVAFPTDDGRLQLSPHSWCDVVNWMRRALATIQSLDFDVFQASDVAGYLAARAADPRGMAVRGLAGHRDNAVHHPELFDPAVERATGPGTDGLYVISPRWADRTPRLDPVFSSRAAGSRSPTRRRTTTASQAARSSTRSWTPSRSSTRWPPAWRVGTIAERADSPGGDGLCSVRSSTGGRRRVARAMSRTAPLVARQLAPGNGTPVFAWHR